MLLTLLKHLRSGRIIHYKDRDFHKGNILYFQTDHLTILNPSEAPLHIDGDPAATASNFSIQIIPNAFKLLQP
jgi:diacylglycerol kinase (ATP)